MGLIVPFDPRGLSWHPRGASGRFRPLGALRIQPWHEGRRVRRKNYSTAAPTLSARLVTGLGTAPEARSVADLVTVVRSAGAHTFADERWTPFFVIAGTYSLRTRGRWIEEPGAAVFLLNSRGEDAAVFRASAIALAETIAQQLGRSEAILEIQLGGISQQVIGVRP